MICIFIWSGFFKCFSHLTTCSSFNPFKLEATICSIVLHNIQVTEKAYGWQGPPRYLFWWGRGGANLGFRSIGRHCTTVRGWLENRRTLNTLDAVIWLIHLKQPIGPMAPGPATIRKKFSNSCWRSFNVMHNWESALGDFQAVVTRETLPKHRTELSNFKF